MRLRSKPSSSLRGSVTQNRSVRLDTDASSDMGVLMKLGLIALSLTILLGLAMWLWHIGWPQQQAERAQRYALSLTQRAHFAVTDIQVEGREQTSKEQIATALSIGAGAAILDFDPAAAAARIAKLPWVGTVTVERRLPDTIIVQLNERKPFVRWQHDGHTIVVDEEGKELPGATVEQFGQLPLIVGAGAAVEAKMLLTALKDYPAVAEKMSAAVWVGLRRWDIYLAPKIIVKLPEGGMTEGLKRLSDLITDQKILDRNVTSIDLRYPDRIIMDPATPPAPEQTAPAPATRL